MNFLKRFLNKFRKQEDDIFDEYIQPETDREIVRNHEMETKVIYQYPKGVFRFPLIPDEEFQEKERRKDERMLKEIKLNQHYERNQIKRSNRTFRPSEPPSPIFGYKRKNESKPIIFELDEFLPEEKGKDEPLYISRLPEEKLLGNEETHRNQEKLHIFEEKIGINEEAVKLVTRGDVEENGEDIEGENNTVEDKRIFTTNVVQNEKEEIILAERDELEGKEEQNPFNDFREKSSEESPHFLPVPQEEEILGREIDARQNNESIENHSQSSQRSHIPFNVIMLQSDKRKLANKLNSPYEKQEVVKEERKDRNAYTLPKIEFLNPPVLMNVEKDWIELQKELLNETLFHFNVRATVKHVTQGPSVTRFEVQPEPGVKVNKITNLVDDIKLSLAAKDIRIEAPIPGTHMIGIEVPNKTSRPVFISEVLKSETFRSHPSPLAIALGLDISGEAIVTDIRKMPHGLIAGSTGSGKSVCINSILISILYKAHPDEVKLMLIDPKVVELQPYNDIPHLVSPVITDVKAATAALKWAVDEMERRYDVFAEAGVRDIGKFNEKALEENQPDRKLPYLVIIIDELADLMMMAPQDVEEAICRIAQKARACGIHLIIATQRPSVDVITGLIKANIPTRIAFSVSSQVDSRTIIDHTGAERLLGKGDMLFLENGSLKPVRLQGTFVTDEEINLVVNHVKGEQGPKYLFEQEELIKKSHIQEDEDELFYEACEFILEQGHASASSLQRRFKIGYNRAARLIEMMEACGFISESKGSKPRDVLFTEDDLHSLQ